MKRRQKEDKERSEVNPEGGIKGGRVLRWGGLRKNGGIMEKLGVHYSGKSYLIAPLFIPLREIPFIQPITKVSQNQNIN